MKNIGKFQVTSSIAAVLQSAPENTVTAKTDAANPTAAGSYVEKSCADIDFVRLKSVDDIIELAEGRSMALYLTKQRILLLATAPGGRYANWLLNNSVDEVLSPQPGIYTVKYRDTLWNDLQTYAETAPVPQHIVTPHGDELTAVAGMVSDDDSATQEPSHKAQAPSSTGLLGFDINAEVQTASRDMEIDIPVDVTPMFGPMSSAGQATPRRTAAKPVVTESPASVVVPAPQAEEEKEGFFTRAAKRLFGEGGKPADPIDSVEPAEPGDDDWDDILNS